jgi:acyl-CoA reductase-like NAD-dependent aldehyde dehydrogenase
MLDLNAVKNGIASILSQMRYFFEPKPIKLDMLFLGDSCEERNVPFGVVLIIGTWNYVLQATLLPLLG